MSEMALDQATTCVILVVQAEFCCGAQCALLIGGVSPQDEHLQCFAMRFPNMRVKHGVSGEFNGLFMLLTATADASLGARQLQRTYYSSRATLRPGAACMQLPVHKCNE